MLILTMTVCLLTAPADCRRVDLPMLAEFATPWQCQHNGTLAAVKWSAENPKWTVRRFKCVPESRLEKGA